MSKDILALDIDEVLFPFVEEFSAWHNQEYGTDLRPVDFTTYEFENVLKESIPETVHRVRTFLRQDHAHLEVSPLEEAQESITLLSQDFALVAITARHPEFEAPTKQYLMHHFDEIIGDVTLVGHKETVTVVKPKAEVCKEVGALALIDDSAEHVLKCEQSNIQGVLFGNYPWTKSSELPDSVVHCLNWAEVLEYFDVTAR